MNDIFGFARLRAHEFRLIFGTTHVEFDLDKDESNRRKHKYSLSCAVDIFESALLLQSAFVTSDAFKKNGEIRHIHLAKYQGCVVLIVTTMHNDGKTVRIISMRDEPHGVRDLPPAFAASHCVMTPISRSTEPTEMLETLSVLSNIATAAAVVVAAWQLVLAHRQGVTNFEDSFAKEYRDLASKLPTKALLGDPLTEAEYAEHFDEMYHYFDLCNEQVFLHNVGRISEKTWVFWKDGISANMRRPGFKRAWSEIASRANNDFSELKAIFPPEPYAPTAD